MKELRNKIRLLVYSILTFCLLIIIVIFNGEKYIEERNHINNNLNISLESDKKRDNPPLKPIDEDKFMVDRNTKFMDSTIYTIIIDKDNNIKEIINHSNNNLSNGEISIIAKNILSDKNIKNKYIGFLYFNNYSYLYIENNSLVILDNSDVRNRLVNSLNLSILIFIILEFVIIYIANVIAKWISKPVEDSFNRQREFIADASHELKTPLAVIMASTYAFKKNPQDDKWVNNIEEEANRMNKLITSLLDLAKSEEDNTMFMEEGNLSKVIELSMLTFEAIANEKEIKIKDNIKKNIRYSFDEGSIKQLMEILMDNAIKHSINKGIIKVSLDEDNKYITLMVSNKGEGIPKGEEEKIFERFYRVDKSRNRNGLRYGLGLAIAKNIVSKHNGKIRAYSEKGITTFEVLFKK